MLLSTYTKDTRLVLDCLEGTEHIPTDAELHLGSCLTLWLGLQMHSAGSLMIIGDDVLCCMLFSNGIVFVKGKKG